MEESVRISKKPPDSVSKWYDRLRETGIERVQELAGHLWTDYNSHDPGVTILEVLCYAITDLGHRTGQPVKDILAPDPDDPAAEDIRNFLTAAQVLPNKPLTIDDLRKVVIDVSVRDDTDEETYVGVKNAWIDRSETPEIPVYTDTDRERLIYKPVDTDAAGDPLTPKKDNTKAGGDINDLKELDIRPLYNVLLEFEYSEKYGDLNQNRVIDSMTVEDADDPLFEGLQIRMELKFPRWDEEGQDWDDIDLVRKSIRDVSLRFSNKPARYDISYETDKENRITVRAHRPGFQELPMEKISKSLNAFIDDRVDHYRQKINKILEILNRVKHRLHANRNLCEDFLRFHSLKVEGIAVCADIELDTEADIEEVQAEIYRRIGQFLSPAVRFYSLEELREQQVPAEEIFEGPLLEHGFIKDEELKVTGRREVIYVSDLIQIIMGVSGVVSVRHIEIANLPQDNVEGIPTRSVKWCLELAHQYNYVPRLSVSDSSITFYKEDLPFRAGQAAADRALLELQAGERSMKILDPVLDLKVPGGRYLDLGRYTSIQEEFPLLYGTGEDGLPDSASDERKAQAKQLKGYLTIFDQLLANYLAQLHHVKDLFSMNPQKDEEGKHVINSTYFTQTVTDIIPNGDELIRTEIDTQDGTDHAERLNGIAESREHFIKRRNRILDHLMARFAEQFTDYATLTWRLKGMKGKRNLIDDKLQFLNNYPEISSSRGTAFNYLDPCRLWHLENQSGLEDRVSMLIGIDRRPAGRLVFSSRFVVTGEESAWGYEVRDDDNTVLMTGPADTEARDQPAAKAIIEELVLNGVSRENYRIADGVFYLECNGKRLAVSNKSYPDEDEAEKDILRIIGFCEEEFFGNAESNRKNLSAPIENYFRVKREITPGENSYIITYRLYRKAFSEDPDDLLMEGEWQGEAGEGEDVKQKAREHEEDWIWEVIASGARKDHYTFFEDDKGKSRIRLSDRFGRELGVVAADIKFDGWPWNQGFGEGGPGSQEPGKGIGIGGSENPGIGKGVGEGGPGNQGVGKGIGKGGPGGPGTGKGKGQDAGKGDEQEQDDRERIVQKLTDFFYETFFSNEGFHLLENILLRPRVNEHLFVEADDQTLEDAGEKGTIAIEKKPDILSTVRSSRIFRVGGDITEELKTGSVLRVSGTLKNDGEYEVSSVTFKPDNNKTEIRVKEAITETVSEPQGELSYKVSAPVTDVGPAERKVVTDEKLDVSEGDRLTLSGSEEGINDGIYKAESATTDETGTSIIVASVKKLVRDRLLPISLDDDCIHCRVENPYTYIANVIVPYWQGRFNNLDFRSFMERKLRLEAPAHIFLSISWINNRQMKEFEEKYKKWMIENARIHKDKAAWSKAQNELVDILYRLRNVYPVGRLHDREEMETLEESMILNHSILGSA